MHTKMFTTNERGELLEQRVFSGQRLAGVTIAQRLGEKANTGFLGLGAAITGSSCYNLSLMERNERSQLLESLYSKEGLGLSIGRLTIGASDYSPEIYTYDDETNDISLKCFSIDRDREYIIPIVKEILAINPKLKLFASPWSPPAWMKTGGSIGGGYMRREYLDCYAEYIIKFIKEYEKEGISIYAITPQNEPEAQQNGKMPACAWHPDIEVEFVSKLRKRLDEEKLDTRIWCFDHNFNGANRVDWCLNEYENFKRDCDGVAFHYYNGCIEQTAFLLEKYPNLKLHFTEGGPRLFDNYATDWCKWTLMVIKALSNGYSSFTGWNLMLDEAGGPNVGPFFCGGLVTRNAVDGSLTFSGQYKAFKHFRGLNENSKIYPLSLDNKSVPMFEFNRKSDLKTSGVLIENEEVTMLVLTNPSDKKEQIQYCHNGEWWYIEMLPDTSSTIVFE